MNRNGKKTISQRICETLDIPVGTFGRISFVEVAGNRELGISGCEGLMVYTGERIVLTLCDGVITVCGEGLELHSFSGGRVSISGTISGISYGDVAGETDVR